MDKSTAAAERDEFSRVEFEQAFTEKRRCEDVIWDACKFAFTVHAATITAALGLYQFALEAGHNLAVAAVSLLCIATICGALLLFLMIRTRIYFVVACRYINEQRAFFTGLPGRWKSTAEYYADPTLPHYFNWQSSQIWSMLVVSALNAAALGAAAGIGLQPHPRLVGYVASTMVVVLILEGALISGYLSSLEGKTLGAAVFRSAPGGPRGGH